MSRNLVKLLLMLVVIAGTCFGQSGLGTISGRVADSSGAVLVDAPVVAVNTETQVVTKTVTNQTGIYQLLRLRPGPYTLTVEVSGFKKLERGGITVQVGDRLTIDLTLAVGQTTEVISVTAEAPLLRPEDAQTGEVINNRMIADLPQLNRDPLALLRLSGNVQGGSDRAGRDQARNNVDTRINGGRTGQLEYFVDGVTVGTGMGRLVSSLTPTTEGVAEFRVITNGISAEYGRFSGGAVELVTKAGTNEYHGQAFEYIRNRVFNASNWVQNHLAQKKPLFQNNIFGGAVGGPISIPKLYDGENRSFFYFNYEGTRYRQAGTARGWSVPTEKMRNGDFTDTMVNNVPALLYDQDGPVGTANDPLERTLLLGGDGKHVPASRFDPVSVFLYKNVIPMPNRAPSAGSNWIGNYVGLQSSKSQNDTWALRFDQVVTANQRFFGRVSTVQYNAGQSQWYSKYQATPSTKIQGGLALTANYDWTLSPTTVLSIRAGGYHNPLTTGNVLPDPKLADTIPWDATTKRLLGGNGALPVIEIQNVNQMLMPATPRVFNGSTYNAAVSLAKIVTKHTLRYGYEHRRYYDNYFTGGDAQFWFQENPVARLATDSGWGKDQSSANVMAAFLMGLNDRADTVGATTRAMAFNYHAAYIQDDFKVTPRLTLNLGLRWDMETPVTERGDKLYFWDPDAPPPFKMKAGYNFAAEVTKAGLNPASVKTPAWATAGFLNGAARIANTPEFPSRHGTSYNWKQFAPRFGFAYQAADRTVIRGAIGKVYLSSSGDANALATAGQGIALADSAMQGWHYSDSPTAAMHFNSTFVNPYTKPNAVKTYQRNNATVNLQATGGDPALIAYNMKSHQPHEWNYNLGVQRELGRNLVGEVYFAGNRGVDLLGPDQISRFPKDLFIPSNYNTYVNTNVTNPTDAEINPTNFIKRLAALEYPYPYFGPVVVQGTNLGKSSYRSMNFRFEKRMSSGYAFLLNYTMSQMKDNVGGTNLGNQGIYAGGTAGKSWQSVDTPRDVYGYAVTDETHRLSAYYAAQLPFGKGRRFLGSPAGIGGKLLDYTVGGWEFSGLSSWRSGRPLIIDGGLSNNDARIETGWSKFATSDHNLGNPGYAGKSAALVSADAVALGTATRRLDPTKVIAQEALPRFTYGDVNLYADIRQPSRFMHDLSMMKSFPIREGAFLQFRVEAQNAFNMRGWPNFRSRPGSPTEFGLMVITNDAGSNGGMNPSRQLQLSARIVF
jgi:hypothetical protein